MIPPELEALINILLRGVHVTNSEKQAHQWASGIINLLRIAGYEIRPELYEAICDHRAEITRLRALVEDCLRYMHNDFEPDNQSAVYYRVQRELRPAPTRDR